jgi:ABC-type antimicrobial peptide transport system permease subunit
VEFYSVTNTYLSIFLALGALGMILGTIGLAVILARTILERRREIALMQAIGFGTRQLFRLLVNEYLILLAAGVLTGLVTAVVATLPFLYFFKYRCFAGNSGADYCTHSGQRNPLDCRTELVFACETKNW